MAILIFLIVIGILVAGGFLIGFIWSVKSGQYDDLYSPAVRVLFDDQIPEKKEQTEENNKEEVEEKSGGDGKTEGKINQ